MQQSPNPPISRFDKKSKALLVDYINRINNRLLKPEQLVFDTPVLINETGLSQVQVSAAANTGWDTSKRTLTYNRVDLKLTMHGQPLVVHVKQATPASVIAALFEQYGLFIEPELVDLTLITTDISDAPLNMDLPGFDPANGPVINVEPIEPPYLDNQNYRMTFKPAHLIFFGEIEILTRRSLELLGTTIDSLMDLRQFYSDGNFNRPPIDLYVPAGEFKLDDVQMILTERRMYESQLYGIPEGQYLFESNVVAPLLRKLTGDPWVSVEVNDRAFNLYGSQVLYNGFVSKDYTVEDPAFNFVMVVALGRKCLNLSGIVKIAYRYSDSKTPGNLAYDHSSVPAIFTN